jgi:hypothetical protein
MSLEDKGTQTEPNEQQRHQCDFCVKSYKNKSHLTYHVKTTHYRSSDKKPIYRFFQCRVCHQGRRNLLLLNVQRSNVFCNFSVWNFVRAVTAWVFMSYSRKSAIDEKRRGFRLATMGTHLRCGVSRRGSGEEGKAEKEEEAGGRSHCCHCRTLARPPKKCDVNTYNFDTPIYKV